MTWTPETNRIPWGLLTDFERIAIQECSHGWEWLYGGRWTKLKYPSWSADQVYRTKPAPKRIVTWLHWDAEIGVAEYSTKDAITVCNGDVVYRFERNEDGSDPTIAVEDV